MVVVCAVSINALIYATMPLHTAMNRVYNFVIQYNYYYHISGPTIEPESGRPTSSSWSSFISYVVSPSVHRSGSLAEEYNSSSYCMPCSARLHIKFINDDQFEVVKR